MEQQIFLIISLIGMLQGCLLAFLFYRKTQQHQAHLFLSIFLLLFSLGLLEPFLEKWDLGIGIMLPNLLGSTVFLYAPLIYLFVKSIPQNLEAKDIWKHLFPFFLIAIISMLESIVSIDQDLIDIIDLFLFEGLVLQVLIYSLLAIKMVKQYLVLEKELIATDKYSLQWLYQLLILLTATYIFSFTISHLLLFGFPIKEYAILWVQVPIALLLYWLSYKVMKEPNNLFLIQRDNITTANATKGNYQKSGLHSTQANEIKTQLIHLIETQKPYLQNDLSINELATQLKVSRHHLTQVINQDFGKNFYRFINEYRVKEAQSLLLNPQYQHYTLLAIGLEAGFNSKPSFNNNFKKITGLTPSQWKKEKGNFEALATKRVST